MFHFKHSSAYGYSTGIAINWEEKSKLKIDRLYSINGVICFLPFMSQID